MSKKAGTETARSKAGSRSSIGLKLVKLLVVSVLVVGIAFLVDRQTPDVASKIVLDAAPPLLLSESAALELMDDAEIWTDLPGPESVVQYRDGNLITGLSNGSIVMLSKQGRFLRELAVFPRFVNASDRIVVQRPLGLHLKSDNSSVLYVVMTHQGVFSVDVDKPGSPPQKVYPWSVNDNFSGTWNNVVSMPDGNLIVSQSSLKYPLEDLVAEFMLGTGNGRVLYVNPALRTDRILLDEINFANGVQLLNYRDGGNFDVLVSETFRFRLLRIEVTFDYAALVKDPPKASVKAKISVWSVLPGMPDNIRLRPSNNEEYWVAIPLLRHSGLTFSPIDFCAARPRLRSYLAHWLPSWLLMSALNTLPNSMYGLVVLVNSQGQVIRSLHDPSGRISQISEATETKEGNLIIGGFSRNTVARLALKLHDPKI